jgi:hypothetical protein
MNSRPDDRRILTLVDTTKTSSKKRKRERNITLLARNRTLLQEIDQELPGVSHLAAFDDTFLKNS